MSLLLDYIGKMQNDHLDHDDDDDDFFKKERQNRKKSVKIMNKRPNK